MGCDGRNSEADTNRLGMGCGGRNSEADTNWLGMGCGGRNSEADTNRLGWAVVEEIVRQTRTGWDGL